MNKLDAKTTETDEGWIVQVYGSNRRLLCVLEPSHGWIFLAGCVLGLTLAILMFNVSRYPSPTALPEPTTPSEPKTEPNALTGEPPFWVD
ncbi:MAG: hypothetical protein F6K42_01200 [Leptolyngbya sp. SIO1D8]|nr:hypothetical protein [Leptolyngbya sp. SIO1D8]